MNFFKKKKVRQAMGNGILYEPSLSKALEKQLPCGKILFREGQPSSQPVVPCK